MPIVLNVGGGASKALPPGYSGWEQHVLDIDPDVDPDVLCDALKLREVVAEGTYDAVYCSHNLEHFYQHDVPTVLAGFVHVLKPGGTVEVHVPNLANLMEQVVDGKRDINDIWYCSGGGPITFHDVLYGWSKAMKGGNLFYAHKCGFTAKSLKTALTAAGFNRVTVSAQDSNLMAKAKKCF